MSAVDQLKHHLLQWNVRFPLDRSFRLKHNIVFGSEDHKRINQIDIYLEHLENNLYIEIYEEAKEAIAMEKEFEEGKWLKAPRISEKQELDLFDKLKIGDIDSNIQVVD